MDAKYSLRAATVDDLPLIAATIGPYVAERQLIPRSPRDLKRLIPHAFVTEVEGEVVGCAALEIYSDKFSEIQCLAVDRHFHHRGLGRALVAACVERAREQSVLEVMAVTSDEAFLQACGFDFALPNEKKAIFAHPKDLLTTDQPDVRTATTDDIPDIATLIEPFVAQKKLYPRSDRDLRSLFGRGFVAEVEGIITGCCALEIYSLRFSELQCLAVAPHLQGRGIGKQLVRQCLRYAWEENVQEVLAISSSEDFFHTCGFSCSTPDQRKALFRQTRDL